MPKYSVEDVLEIIKGYTAEEKADLQAQLPRVLGVAAIPDSPTRVQTQQFQAFSETESEFIEASVETRDRLLKEKEERQKRELRLAQRTTAGAVAAVLVMSAVAFFTNIQRLEAVKQATIATLREKAARSDKMRSVQPVEALVLAIQATGESQAKLQQVLEPVQSSLLAGVQIPIDQNRFQGHQDQVISVAFSPDGQSIVSGSRDKTVRLWNLKGEAIGTPFKGHQDSVMSVAFSPNGQSIVSGSFDKTVRLWNLKGEQIGTPFKGHQELVSPVAFSPDGQYIVSGSGDKTVRLWNLKGEAIGTPFVGHQDSVSSVAFSPDGQYIVSGSWDNTVRLWNLKGKLIGTPFKGHQSEVYSVAFSPDGQSIVSGSYDKTVRLWNLKGEAIGTPFKGHQSEVYSVAFSPDGQSIVSGSRDNTVRLWNLKGEPISTPFIGHQDRVISVAFSPDGQSIVSGSWDRTVWLWNLKGESIGTPFVGRPNRPDSDETGQLRPGSWKALLKLGCNRLRDRPILNDPEILKQDEVARGARETCEKYVWNRR